MNLFIGQRVNIPTESNTQPHNVKETALPAPCRWGRVYIAPLLPVVRFLLRWLGLGFFYLLYQPPHSTKAGIGVVSGYKI
jgi:hypothetical protein